MKQRKSYNWYAAKQRFSIRKYHFGAASVLLGVSLALAGGAKALANTVEPDTLPQLILEAQPKDEGEGLLETGAEFLESSVPVEVSTEGDTLTPVETVTEETQEVVERTATINYIVQYLLEDGTLVDAVVKSATVTTTDATAKTTVEVTAELPEGYVLAEGQKETTSNQVTEGAENLVTIKVVKKAEVAATETAAPVAPTPATEEEAKVVLEQNISEAVVLSDEANRLYTAAPEGNESLKAAADATKLSATEATTVLKDSVVTLEKVNEQINAVRTNVEALALELRKRDEDGVLTVRLAGTTALGTGSLALGDGSGNLATDTSTADAPFADANGSGVSSATSGNMVGTEVEGYYTFHFASLDSYYNPIQKETYKGTQYAGSYFRTSSTGDPATEGILVELVDASGTVLESYKLNVGEAATFTSYEATSAVDDERKNPIVVTFEGETQTASTAGNLLFQFDTNTIVPSYLVPRPSTFTTYYKDKTTGETLGEYTTTTLPGLINIPSEERDFTGYEFVESTTEKKEYLKYAETSYIDAVRNPTPAYPMVIGDPVDLPATLSLVNSKVVANPVDNQGTITKDYYIVDPTSTATRNYTNTSSDGFFKLFTTSEFAPSGSNTNTTLDAGILDKFKVYQAQGNVDNIGTGTPITDPADLALTIGGDRIEIVLNENATNGELKAIRVGMTSANRLVVQYIRTPVRISDTQYEPYVVKGEIQYNENGKVIPGGNTGVDQGYPINTTPVFESTSVTTHWYEKVPAVGSVIVYYKDTAGKELQPLVVDSLNLTVGEAYDTTDRIVQTITTEDGTYVLVPSKTEGAETGTIVEGDTVVTYVYQKVANWIPQIPGVPETDYPKLPYPFDPANPDVPVTPTPSDVIPYVPGYTPVDPNTNEPLTPVDPADPSKGYTPPIPENPGVDTKIPYKAIGSVVVEYKDTEGNPLQDSVTDTKDAVVDTPYDTTDNKPTELTKGDYRYVLVESKTVGNETGNVVAGTTTVTYVYQKVANWIPQIPGVEVPNLPKIEYPFDPTNPDVPVTPTPSDVIPYVPGYVPVGPDGETPLTPVDPADPSKGYEPPVPENPGVDTYIPYKAVGSVVINYVDTEGNELQASVTDEKDVLVGKAYDTTDEGDKPTELTVNGDKYVLVEAKTVGSETGTITAGTTTVTYVYQKVANWIPQIPGVPTNELPKTEYPFDPTTPDAEIPSIPTNPDTNTPVVPYVPGFTPVDPNTNEPLKPVDPADPSKGYEPPVPSNPGVDTLIPYVQDKGSVTIQYKDTDGNVIKAPVIDEDNVAVGTAYDTTNEGDKPTVIPNADGTKYVLVPSLTEGAETGTVVKDGTTVTYVYQKVANWIPVIPDLPENERPVLPYPFDPEKPDQPLTPTPDTVIPYVPGYVPVGPDGKTPLTPVDKEDPSKGYTPPTPSTPGDNTYIPYVKVEKGSVLVAFVDEAGSPIKSVVTDTDNAEVGTSYDTTDQKEDVIKANGFTYYFKEVKAGSAETGKVVEGVTTVTYVYTKVANWIPVIPGLPENERPVFPYPFDPTNPDKPIDPTTPGTVIPYVPGYVPVGPDGTTPLTPVDPEDPSKGYVPPTPSTPGDNTYIPYMKAGSVVVKYQDTDGKELIAPVVDENNVKVGTAYDTTDQKKTEIKDAGGNRYVLVPSKTVGSETGEVTDGTTEVIYVYQKVANWIPQIPGVPTDQLPKTSYPFDPEKPTDPITGIPTNPTTDKPVVPFVDGYTPVDPATNTPLTPVDETDLTKGYIPPTVTNPGKDTLIPYVQDKGSVTIQYKDTDGNVIKDPVTDEDNVVVGTPYDTTDEGDKPTEIVTKNGSRYVLVPSKTEGAEKGKVAKNGTTVTYVYQKVANWIPELPGVPDNERPRIPYPFDPNNPDTPLPPSPDTVVPYVPGYIPVGPDGVTPLTPVDPADPSKGYVPPTPKIPNEDMRIPYIPVKKGSVTIQYRDTDGNVIKDSVTDEDNVVVGTPYDTTDEGDKPTEIVTKDGSRYVLVPSKTIGTEKGQVSEGASTVTYVYQKVANWIPELPGVPDNERPRIPYPFDPNNPDTPLPPSPDTVVPYVPGYIPVGPDGVTPLTPVDPADPSKGYVPPTPKTPNEDMRIPYIPVKKGSVTIQYRDTDGNVIKDPVTDEDNVVVGTPYDTTDEGDKPTEIVTKDGSRYVLVPSKTIGTEKGQVSEGSSTVTYVYQKVANWIPELPGVPDNERPRIPYPFDPNNPDTPLPPSPDTVVPYVPGYIPVGPDGVTPLTPVDPADPSKGYVPPTPKTPNEDMRIPYVPTVPAEPAQPVPPVVPVEPEQPVPPVVPAEPEQPVPPVVPAEPEQPVPPVVPVEPAQPVVPESPKGSELATPHTPTTTKAGAAQLPNTGEANTVALPALGLSMLVATLALAGKRRSMEE